MHDRTTATYTFPHDPKHHHPTLTLLPHPNPTTHMKSSPSHTRETIPLTHKTVPLTHESIPLTQVPYNIEDADISDDWTCAENMWDPAHMSCSIPQELSNDQIDQILHAQVCGCG